MSDDPIALFQRAAALADATVSAVRSDQLGNPRAGLMPRPPAV